MLKNKKYSGMEESIISFNRITGNPECAVSMKYLMHFNWNVEKASKSYLSTHGYGSNPSNEFDIGFKRYNHKLGEKTDSKMSKRVSDPMLRNYKMSWNNNDEKSQTMKKSKSNNLFGDIKPCSTSKVKFDFNKAEESKDVLSQTLRVPKGIMKIKKMESSEVNEEEETTPFKNVNIYELSARASAIFSSEKYIPKFEKLFSFGDNLDTNYEFLEHKNTSKFGVKDE